jgi:hypothetical protein
MAAAPCPPLTPSLTSQDDATPLYIAAQFNSKGVAEVLLKGSADVNRSTMVGRAA